MAIATIRGTAIAPGVSRNKRLYTKELLARAVKRANERLTGGEPMTMLTHHGAEDDSTRIVGRVTSLKQRDDGSVAFEAEIADTAHGRDIAALVTGGSPFLDGVSIRGAWLGKVRRVQHDGEAVEVADELELHGLDFTKTPGVPLARIEPGTGPAEATTVERLVYESVTEATAAPAEAPRGDVDYADPGYLDRQPRYQLETQRRARAAWSHINEADNARRYTPRQLKRVKGRIKKALRQFGVTVTAETAPLVPLAENAMWEAVAECYGDDRAGFSISARNGPINVNISAYDGIEPAELEVIAKAAMAAACAALRAMDPDMDADIDVPGAPNADTDGDMEAARRPDDNQMETASRALTSEQSAALQAAGLLPGTVVTKAVLAEALASTAPAAPVGETTTAQEVPAVSEPTTPAAQAATTPAAAPAVIQLTQEQFQALMGRAPVAETTPAVPAPAAPVVETEDQRIARLVAEGVAAQREELLEQLRGEVRQSGPARKGLRTAQPGGVAETADATSPEAVRAASNEALLSWVSNGRYSNYED
ncbi:hypothetical protein ABIA32_002698 [Streptacidiphilus sp. MAP12-20]|uniref:DUF6582 domain-containing protein n=1 Tax=Streptacidiphilus sp. MAP12-20 TaxID=3156299 RepID=UPI00351137C3